MLEDLSLLFNGTDLKEDFFLFNNTPHSLYHWVPLSYGLVPHISKRLSKLPPHSLYISTYLHTHIHIYIYLSLFDVCIYMLVCLLLYLSHAMYNFIFCHWNECLKYSNSSDIISSLSSPPKKTDTFGCTPNTRMRSYKTHTHVVIS